MLWARSARRQLHEDGTVVRTVIVDLVDRKILAGRNEGCVELGSGREKNVLQAEKNGDKSVRIVQVLVLL